MAADRVCQAGDEVRVIPAAQVQGLLDILQGLVQLANDR